MAYALNKMPQTEGLGAGQTAITRLPTGPTYLELGIRYQYDNVGVPTDAGEAQFQADFSRVRVILDEEDIISLTGSQLLALNKYYKRPFIAGQLGLVFARPWARTAAGENELAFGTLDIQNMSVEVDIAGAATPDNMSVSAVLTEEAPLGRFMTVRSTNYNTGAGGIQEIADFNRGPYNLAAMHIEAATVDDVELLANRKRVFEADRPIAEGFYGDRRAWQTGYFHVDFQARNRISEGLSMVLQDFRAKINHSAAPGNFEIIQERVEQRVPVGLPSAVPARVGRRRAA